MSGKFVPGHAFTTGPSRPETPVEASKTMKLKVEHYFSAPGVHPFEQLEWEIHSARITGDNGQVIFEQDDIEVPASWSPLATKVVASKYFYGDMASGRRERSVKQLVHRVCLLYTSPSPRD